MAILPEKPDKEVLLAEWFKVAADLKRLKACESLMRKSVVKAFFSDPKEGVNKEVLSDGYILEMTQSFDRKIDEAALKSMSDAFNEVDIISDAMLKYKPSLIVSAYRLLTDEQKKVFDQALVIKPASPTGMKISPPKET